MTRRRRAAMTAAAILLGALAPAAPAGHARTILPDGYPALFGSHETMASTLSLFPKWQGAVMRFFDEKRLAEAPCESTTFNRCHLREWLAFLRGIRDRDRMDQLKAVNDYMNRKRYVIDPVNWGVTDYWASPLQFMTKNGDCEDYAIAKYFSLRWLGMRPEDLRVVVLRDMNLRVAHAVLAVYDHGRALILDNQVHSVVEADVIRHYRPIYSINEQHWWLHRM